MAIIREKIRIGIGLVAVGNNFKSVVTHQIALNISARHHSEAWSSQSMR